MDGRHQMTFLLSGISVTVVDTFWGRSGKKNCHADLEAMEADHRFSTLEELPFLEQICR